MSIQVIVKDKVVDYFDTKNPPNLINDINSHYCGGNNYFYENRTVHFIVTDEPDCIVRVRLVDAIQVNARLKMTEDEFYTFDS